MDKSRVIIDMGLMAESIIGHDLFNPVHLRYAATLDHEIDAELLAKAWDRTKRVYPIIDAVFGYDHAVTDYYVEHADIIYAKDHLYLMKPEGGVNDPVRTKVPVIPSTEAVAGRAISVCYYDRTIFISAYHSLLDGGGMTMVFRTLLYSYLALYTGHEDENPIVELTEGRDLSEYYITASPEYIFKLDYTPVPAYTLPFRCVGFYDKEMVNDNGNIYCGNVALNAADFMRLCKENGANPSAMMCAVLGKTAYALNPDERSDMVFGLTVSTRKLLGLDNSIANVVGSAIAHGSYDELTAPSLAEASQRIRKEIDQQRGKDYYLSFSRLSSTYHLDPNFKFWTVTYVGSLNIGENNGHIVDFNMETNGNSNLYLMQLNDKFVLTLQYGMATQKYLAEFVKVFTELGVKAEIIHPAHHVDKDSPTAVM